MSRSRNYSLNIVGAIIGVALLVFTVQRVGGWSGIVEGITSIGWWFAAVVFLGAFRMACRTRAWMVCVKQIASGSGGAGAELHFIDAFSAWMFSDAMGNLTPLGLLASEPAEELRVLPRHVGSPGPVVGEQLIEHDKSLPQPPTLG